MSAKSSNHMFNNPADTAAKYSFEPYEMVLVMMLTKYIDVKGISKAELGEIITPLIISFKTGEPVESDYKFPALAQLIDEAKGWYQGIEKEPDTLGFSVAIDQMVEELDGSRYLLTEPKNFYHFLGDYYTSMAD